MKISVIITLKKVVLATKGKINKQNLYGMGINEINLVNIDLLCKPLN